MKPPVRSQNNNSQENSFLVPDGTQFAHIVGITNVGHQKKTYQGAEKKSLRIMITFELSAKREIQKGDEKIEVPFMFSQEYAFSYFSNSGLKKMIESLLGRTLSDDECQGENAFDIEKILMSPCMIDIQTKTKFSEKHNKEFTNQSVVQVMSIPEALAKSALPPVNKGFVFNIFDYGNLKVLFDCDKWKNLNKYLKAIVQRSDEFLSLKEIQA